MMIDHDIGHTGKTFVAGNGNGGERGCLAQLHVDGDEAFDSALGEDLGITVEHFGVVAMNDCEKKIVLLTQILFDPADDERTIGVANLFDNHSNGIGTFLTE